MPHFKNESLPSKVPLRQLQDGGPQTPRADASGSSSARDYAAAHRGRRRTSAANLSARRGAAGNPARTGLVPDFPRPEAPPQRTLEGLMRHFFGGPVNVIVRGSTHAAEITTVKGVLIVNPGSPTFPTHPSPRPGTLGYPDT